MNVTVCIGSSCHLKGSRQIVQQLQSLIAEKALQEKIELSGAFCIGNCRSGVCVKVEEEVFSLKPEDTKTFFEDELLRRL